MDGERDREEDKEATEIRGTDTKATYENSVQLFRKLPLSLKSLLKVIPTFRTLLIIINISLHANIQKPIRKHRKR